MKGHVADLVPGKKFRLFVYEGRDPVSGRKRHRTKVVTGRGVRLKRNFTGSRQR